MSASSIARRASFSLGRRSFVLRTFAFRVTTDLGAAGPGAKKRPFWPILARRVRSGRPAGSPAVRYVFEPEALSDGPLLAPGQPGEAGGEEDSDDPASIRLMGLVRERRPDLRRWRPVARIGLAMHRARDPHGRLDRVQRPVAEQQDTPG